jgi:hypothetical protein
MKLTVLLETAGEFLYFEVSAAVEPVGAILATSLS